MVGGRKQLHLNSLMVLVALMAPHILDPRGAITSARPTPGAGTQLCLHCCDLQGVTLDTSASLISPAWLGKPRPQTTGGNGPKYSEALGGWTEGAAWAGRP